LHILDIVENSITADAKTIQVRYEEDTTKDLTRLEIKDNGKGMDEEKIKKALDPFFTTKKTRRFGLGLSLLSESAKAAGGSFSIKSKPGKGTEVKSTFKTSHIDKKPLGDMSLTLITLIMAYPEIDFYYIHKIDESEYSIDTKSIKSQLDGLPINTPEVIKYIKTNIKDGIDHLRRKE